MDIEGKTIWQVAAGDGDHNYAGLCLASNVIMVGPGKEGPWPDCEERLRETGSTPKKLKMVERFCVTMQQGDLVVLHIGAKVYGVGEVIGDYVWDPAYGKVQGWDLQHTRPVSWLREHAVCPCVFPARVLRWGDTVQLMKSAEVAEWMKGLEVGDTPEARKKLANTSTGGWGGSMVAPATPPKSHAEGSLNSDDPLLETILRHLGSRAFRCTACGDRPRLWTGSEGPFLECTNFRCKQQEPVSAAVLLATLQELNVRCAICGCPTQVLMQGERCVVACENHPECSYVATWQELRKSLREVKAA